MAKFIEEDMEERPKELNKAELPYADLIMLELFKSDQVDEDSFRDAMKVSLYFSLFLSHSDPNAISCIHILLKSFFLGTQT